MDVLRTPDDRFEGLPEWPFAPRYTEIKDADGTSLRLAYVDEGPADGVPVLLMHGEHPGPICIARLFRFWWPRPPGHRAGPDRLWPVGQTQQAHGLYL